MPTADHADTRFAPRLHSCRRQDGPVTRAIAAMRRDEPPMPPEWEADLEAGVRAVKEIRQRVADRIADAGKTNHAGGGL